MRNWGKGQDPMLQVLLVKKWTCASRKRTRSISWARARHVSPALVTRSSAFTRQLLAGRLQRSRKVGATSSFVKIIIIIRR